MHQKAPRILGLFAATLAFSLFVGCASKREYVPESDPTKPLPPSMQAYGEFFDGKLMVEVSVGRGFRMRPGKMKDFESRYGKHGEDENPFAQVYYMDDQREQVDDQYFIPRMTNSTQPPIALRVRVTNQTGQPIELEFTDCNSTLGNFAVRPEKLTIPAGETGQPDPMTSLLGVTGNDIPLTIGLKVGSAKESKVLVLHAIKDAPPPSPPAAAK